MTTEGRELTDGEWLVWLDFNPSWDKDVQKIKELCAEVIDLIYKHKVVLMDKETETSGEVVARTFMDQSITKMIEAQMWAVKGITFK